MSSKMTDPVAPAPFTTPVSTERVSKFYMWALGAAQFGLFIALLAPVYVTMQLKAQELNPSDPASVIATVLPIGALGALFANPLAGALSDRTRTRWGRRRPWLVGGVLAFLGSLVWLGFSNDVLMLTLGWLLCQVAANSVFAALTASFADNVPFVQRGAASSVIALAQNLAVLAGTYLAVVLVGDLPMLFIAPGIFAVVLVLIYAFVAKDELPDYELKKFTFLNLISSFWTNPFKNPDFGFAWWSRFLIIFATFMFTTYRLLYMQDHIGMGAVEATQAVAFGVLLYTIALLISSSFSGWLSDKLGRRKIFVGGSTALFAVGLILLVSTDTLFMFYVAEIVMGFAYGIYAAVDTALIVDVLPNADRPGKDLGVVNIANALPQSLAPAFAGFLLSIGGVGSGNYVLMLWGAGIIGILGALAIIPIKRVR
ncbi:MFS transporter [Microbacteriaceae bacterium VKM Ac-2855]|nr:MFS transporter [Microbacteriaceae bacterium VKM Ac-2855]